MHDFYKAKEFVLEMMKAINQFGLVGYPAACESHDIKPPAVEDNEDFALQMAEGVIETAPRLIEGWKDMGIFMEGNAIELPGGNSRGILLMVTMAILDEVFLCNNICDRMHNRQMLDEITGMSFDEFLVLRSICNKKCKGKIGFSVMQTARLFQLLDCAAQILTGKVAAELADRLKKKALNKENIQSYLKEVEDLNTQFRLLLNAFSGESFPSNGSLSRLGQGAEIKAKPLPSAVNRFYNFIIKIPDIIFK